MQRWTRLNAPALNIINILSNTIAQLDFRYPGGLPQFRRGSQIIVVSDYATAKAARSSIYSFLITDAYSLSQWKNSRPRLAMGSRRFEYKKMNDRIKLRKFPSFLDHCNQLNGVVVNFVVDASIRSIISPVAGEFSHFKKITQLDHLEDHVAERLARISIFLGLLAGGFSHPGSDVLWVSDDDEILANDDHIVRSRAALMNILSVVVPHDMGQLNYSVQSKFRLITEIQDMGSICDLCCGFLNANLSAGIALLAPVPKMKDRLMASFVSSSGNGLRKLHLGMRRSAQGKIDGYRLVLRPPWDIGVTQPRGF